MKSSFYNIIEENYIYNTLSDNLIVFDDDDLLIKYKNILNSKKNLETKETLELKELGFLLNKEEIEMDKILKKYKDYFDNEDILTLNYIPTFNCNLKCNYCYQEYLDKEDINSNKKLNNFLERKLSKIKKLNLSFFGGEPLMYSNRVLEFIEQVYSLKKRYKFNTHISFTSNGTLYEKEFFKKINSLLEINSIQITIDGDKESHDSIRISDKYKETYDLILKNIHSMLTNFKIDVTVRINLQNDSLKKIEKTILDLKNISNNRGNKGNLNVYFRPIYSTTDFKIDNKNAKNLESFYLLAKEKALSLYIPKIFSCETEGGLNSFYLTRDGDLWKCLQNEDNRRYIGKLKKSGEVGFNSTFLKEWPTFFKNLNKKCEKCKFLPKCFGGCKLNVSKTVNSCFHERNFKLKTLLSNYILD